jgi:dTMP kinase
MEGYLMKKGLKIEVEGTDGAGKTTALKYMIEQLKSRGSTVLETREVGNPHIPICVKLRETVLAPESNLSGEAMELIFAAMRVENEKFMKTVKNDYDYIVSDRGWFSHLAYTDHNVTPEFTEGLYINFMQKLTSLPDVVLYFAVDTNTALKRRVKRGGDMDVIESKGVGYQEQVRESFQKYLDKAAGVHVFVIDANDSVEGVRSQVDKILDILLFVPNVDNISG